MTLLTHSFPIWYKVDVSNAMLKLKRNDTFIVLSLDINKINLYNKNIKVEDIEKTLKSLLDETGKIEIAYSLGEEDKYAEFKKKSNEFINKINLI